ncbi:MAG: DUF362 domain-containing protein [Chitinivibrionales bacterium]|nr:DUF362 domain-containing protein [Chitinivibrionales bacterium]
MANKSVSEGRRKFLKTAGLGAGAAAIGALPIAGAEAAAPGWQNGMAINPGIPNTRVVSCKDSAMVNKTCAQFIGFEDMSPTSGQNFFVNAVKVQANLDELAKSLAQKSSAAEAWAAIFQKPAAKKWKEVKAAIKVNCIAQNHSRVAIVDKICRQLNALGIPYGNIIIFDGRHDARSGKYEKFLGKGLPKDVIVSKGNDALGGMQDAAIPAPDAGSYACTKHIADGSVDILVNCAVCKGHGPEFGNTTMTMKNHFGTFTPQPHGHGTTDYLIAINKSPAIVGGTPARQQLCIVDALWSNCTGPGGIPNADTNRIVMGVCSPVVDYATVKNVREVAPMACAHNATVVNRFLTDFGFSAADVTWVDVKPAIV